MSSGTVSAEQRFREAFDRLKSGVPENLALGTAVTQGNVALEAGCSDASALKKSRFPKLVKEIQAYIDEKEGMLPSMRKQQREKKALKSELKSRIAEITAQRDLAQSQLVSAHDALLAALEKSAQLQARLEELSPPPTRLPR